MFRTISSSLGNIHSRIQESLLDYKIGHLTDRLLEEEYRLLMEEQVLNSSSVCLPDFAEDIPVTQMFITFGHAGVVSIWLTSLYCFD